MQGSIHERNVSVAQVASRKMEIHLTGCNFFLFASFFCLCVRLHVLFVSRHKLSKNKPKSMVMAHGQRRWIIHSQIHKTDPNEVIKLRLCEGDIDRLKHKQ
jgi:hypothetical protein